MARILAVSGGPDSMALLDRSRRNKRSDDMLVVCHVNYNHRPTAKRDEDIVRGYCEKYGIPFYKRDVYEPDKPCNFQAWARDQRYDFFKEIADIYSTKDVYVAHNLDDAVETYIMQKDRGSIPAVYGLRYMAGMKGLNIIRPLLALEKRELQEYCNKQGVPYGIDESNLKDEYTRNKIRHSVVEHMTKGEKEVLFQEAWDRTEELQKIRYETEVEMREYGGAIRVCFGDIGFEHFLYKRTGHHYSKKHMRDIEKKLEAGKAQYKDHIIYWEDGLIHCDKILEEIQPEVLQAKGMLEESGYLKANDQVCGYARVTIKQSDFPLTIRHYTAKDEIQMLYGTKKVSHIVRDKKVPDYKRGQVYVIENRDKRIIYSSVSGADKDHYACGGVCCEARNTTFAS